MKKGIIVSTALVGIAGGFLLAQNTLFGSAEAQITAAEAKKIALEAYAGKVVEFDFDQDDQVPHYEFDIKNGNEKVELSVDAKTGTVTIKEIETAKNNVVEKVEDAAGAVKSDAQIVVNDTKNKVAETTGIVTKPAETVNNAQVEQVQQPATKPQQATETPAQPAAEKTTTTSAAKQISKAQAINIAYTVASGTVVKAVLDADDGRPTYEIELRDGNTEIDVEIDARTGKILEFDKDVEDDDDLYYNDNDDDNRDDI